MKLMIHNHAYLTLVTAPLSLYSHLALRIVSLQIFLLLLCSLFLLRHVREEHKRLQVSNEANASQVALSIPYLFVQLLRSPSTR